MAKHDRSKGMHPRFDLVGKTLLIRISNAWSGIDSPDHWRFMPGINKQKNYEQIDVHNIVVIWNIFEACITEAGSFIWFQNEIWRQFPTLKEIPVSYVLNSGTSINNESNVTLPNTLHYIGTFELSTKLLHDLWPSWHHNIPWQPYTKQILYTPGKLRPLRYLAMKNLIEFFPENLTYVLNRNLAGEGIPPNLDSQELQLNTWIKSTESMIKENGLLCDKFEDQVLPFMLKYENDIIDSTSLHINNWSQLIGYKNLETTSISAVVETTPGENFYTEKTNACIVAGRPFIHYTPHPETDYLERLGYKLFYNQPDKDYHSMNKWIENFIIRPDVDRTKETIQHNLSTLERNVTEYHKTMASVMPEWSTLSPQSQIDILTTFLKINT